MLRAEVASWRRLPPPESSRSQWSTQRKMSHRDIRRAALTPYLALVWAGSWERTVMSMSGSFSRRLSMTVRRMDSSPILLKP